MVPRPQVSNASPERTSKSAASKLKAILKFVMFQLVQPDLPQRKRYDTVKGLR
jgi:hypothetical protein